MKMSKQGFFRITQYTVVFMCAFFASIGIVYAKNAPQGGDYPVGLTSGAWILYSILVIGLFQQISVWTNRITSGVGSIQDVLRGAKKAVGTMRNAVGKTGSAVKTTTTVAKTGLPGVAAYAGASLLKGVGLNGVADNIQSTILRTGQLSGRQKPGYFQKRLEEQKHKRFAGWNANYKQGDPSTLPPDLTDSEKIEFFGWRDKQQALAAQQRAGGQPQGQPQPQAGQQQGGGQQGGGQQRQQQPAAPGITVVGGSAGSSERGGGVEREAIIAERGFSNFQQQPQPEPQSETEPQPQSQLYGPDGRRINEPLPGPITAADRATPARVVVAQQQLEEEMFNSPEGQARDALEARAQQAINVNDDILARAGQEVEDTFAFSPRGRAARMQYGSLQEQRRDQLADLGETRRANQRARQEQEGRILQDAPRPEIVSPQDANKYTSSGIVTPEDAAGTGPQRIALPGEPEQDASARQPLVTPSGIEITDERRSGIISESSGRAQAEKPLEVFGSEEATPQQYARTGRDLGTLQEQAEDAKFIDIQPGQRRGLVRESRQAQGAMPGAGLPAQVQRTNIPQQNSIDAARANGRPQQPVAAIPANTPPREAVIEASTGSAIPPLPREVISASIPVSPNAQISSGGGAVDDYNTSEKQQQRNVTSSQNRPSSVAPATGSREPLRDAAGAQKKKDSRSDNYSDASEQREKSRRNIADLKLRYGNNIPTMNLLNYAQQEIAAMGKLQADGRTLSGEQMKRLKAVGHVLTEIQHGGAVSEEFAQAFIDQHSAAADNTKYNVAA